MQVTDRRSLLRELRQFCYTFREEYSQVSNVVDQYYLLSDIIELSKQKFGKAGRKRVLYTSEILYEVAKIFGVSSQTLYRARSAVRSARNGTPPKKYALSSLKNINHKIRKW
jgi:hypothetical protein